MKWQQRLSARLLILSLVCLVTVQVNAQSIEGGNTNTNSGNISNQNIELDFSIGILAAGQLEGNLLSLYNLLFITENEILTAINNSLLNGKYLKLYPNPLSYHLTIETDLNDIGNIIILDNSLRILLNVSWQQGEQIDFSTYSSGIYIIRIFSLNGDLITTHKVLKR